MYQARRGLRPFRHHLDADRMVSVCIEKPHIMVSRGLGRFRVASAKKRELPNTPLPLPHPATPNNLPTSRTKSLSHRSSAGDLAPASKPSGLDQALKLIHPRTSTISKAKLKLAPSGASVFTPAQSQESLGSSILPGKAFLLCMSIQES